MPQQLRHSGKLGLTKKSQILKSSLSDEEVADDQITESILPTCSLIRNYEFFLQDFQIADEDDSSDEQLRKRWRQTK